MIRIDAQACLDALGAVGLLAYALTLAVRRWEGPLAPRLILLFGLMAAFYALRSLYAFTGVEGLQIGAFAAVALTPVAALLLAEGVLRRHAPKALKLAVMAASAVAVGFALLTAWDMGFDARMGLAAPIGLSLLAILALLGARDRGQLSAGENRVVGALALGLAVSLPLMLTDFVRLVNAPLGLSAIGVLLIVLVILTAGSGEPRGAVVEVPLLLALAAGLGLGLARALAIGGAADLVRLCALILAGLIAASLLTRLLAVSARRDRLGLRQRLAEADTRSLAAFLADLGEEPLLKDMTILREGDLVDHGPATLAETLARAPIWSLERLKAGEARASQTESEPLIDLLERGGATHLGLLSMAPVRIGLIQLSGLSGGEAAETDLALAFRLARLSAGGKS
ncbi:hypothetical protein [Caulobacter hibisci]|uniref:Uncharacterized protein n=1 Tax=Caulobacter hibisci TaxID=2035993 RepID=A0ABS0T146_9CAUL|nr:hypothetical protein [Caulobacter hibisci]MBI1685579.1 hypothetical protein [Caulobacter hibisci]